MSSSEVLDRLASKSDEFSSYCASDMAELCNALLTNFRNREHEWSDAGNWRAKEISLFRLYEKDKTPSGTIPLVLSQSKQLISATMSKFISTCVESYEYEAGKSTKKPQFLEKEKNVKMEDGSDRSYSTYGPLSVGVPYTSFELHTLPTKEEQASVDIKSKTGSITVILGAGNQPQLSLFDVLQRTLVHREVVFLKHHPLRPHLIALYTILLEPLIKRGFLHQILDSGIPETTKILSHKSIGHVHLTGSLATDKAVRTLISKVKPHLSQSEVDGMVSSELGACTPCIFSDGKYTEKEITHAVRIIVYAKKLNGGSNCLCPQAIVIPKDWEQKDQFRKALYDELKRQPNQPVYYPGSTERAQEMVKVYKSHGESRATVVECTKTIGFVNRHCDNVAVVECGSPNDTDYENMALRSEAFGPVLAIVELSNDGNKSEDYLNTVAVPFLNNKENIFGSLSCILFAPASFDPKKVSIAVESLEYGTIALNTPNLIGWIAASAGAFWGAHPSAPGRESGAGLCGNQFKVSSPAKTVVQGPSLATAPAFDGAKPPPKLILDALSTMDCSNSTLVGILRIQYLLFVSFLNVIMSPFIPADTMKLD